MDFDQQKELEKICSDIFQGYTKYPDFYIKHFNFFDQSKIDVSYKYYYNQAIENGIPTEQQQLEFILKDPKFWSQEKEDNIEICRKQIRMFSNQVQKAHIISHQKIAENALKEEENKLNKLLKERKELIGHTAEDHASYHVNNVYVISSIFKDVAFKKPYIDEKEYEYLEDEKLIELTSFHLKHGQKFSQENIKLIVICPFFRNIFSICESNPYSFYGKPVVELTFFQNDLFSWGKTFSSIFSSERGQNIPKEILFNPEEILKWYNRTNNLHNLGTKNQFQDGDFAVVGASSKEMKEAGYQGGLNLGDGKKPMGIMDFVKRGK